MTGSVQQISSSIPTLTSSSLPTSPVLTLAKPILSSTPLTSASLTGSSASHIQLSPEQLKQVRLETGLTDWCNEVKGTPEYDHRVRASKTILTAHQNKSEFLNLFNSNIKKLPEIISELNTVISIRLFSTKITDISVLSKMTHLQGLSIDGSQVSDLRPLSALTGLRSLRIAKSQISDISTLASLPNLQRLNLSNNQITDLRPLAALTSLRELELAGNQIKDVTPLAGMTQLEVLDLSRNPIVDINSLPAPTTLIKLDLTKTAIATLPLSLARLPKAATIITSGTPLPHTELHKFQAEIAKAQSENPNLGPSLELPFTTDYDAYDMVSTMHFDTPPVIARATHSTASYMGPKTSALLGKLGATPLDVDINFEDVDPFTLSDEVQRGIQEIRKENKPNTSCAIELMKKAAERPDLYPTIRKIQMVATDVMSRSQGVAIPGGPNVEQEFYDGSHTLVGSDYRRTIAEMSLISAAKEQNKPVLGTCRGAQLLNVFYGGSLKQGGHVGWQTIGLLDSPKRAKLEEVVGDLPLNAYSHHFQCCDRVASNFVVGMEQNGIPKLLISKDDMIIGTQVHPEYDEHDKYSKSIEIYKLFFQKIKELGSKAA